MSAPPFNPAQGSAKAGKHTLPDLWSTLHRLARGWCDLWESKDIAYERSNVDRMTFEHLSALQEVKVERWTSLCDAAGWTSYGAIAASWCDGAKLEHVWQGWAASGVPILPNRASMRPAGFICPNLLPTTQSIRELTEVVGNDQVGMSALITALAGKVTLDISIEALGNAPPQVASTLLVHRSTLGPPAASEELVAVWKKTITGTEFDCHGHVIIETLL